MPIIYTISLILISIYYIYITIIKHADELYIENAGLMSPTLQYVVVIPCFNEDKVIRATLSSLLDFSLPNLAIYVIDDDSSDDTIKIVNDFNDPRINLIEKHKPNAQKGKGHSLNTAYQRILKDYSHADPENVIITILDADGFLCPNAFEIADRIFSHPTIHGIQARVRIINNYKQGNLLSLLQDIEFYEVIGAMQKFRMKTKTVGLGGNGQFTRLSSLKKLSETPWTDCLLEDYDLTIRLLLNKDRLVYSDQLVIYQQGLTSYRRYLKQRSRWIQGSLQCHSYIRRVITSTSLTGSGKLEMLFFLIQPYLNLLNSIIVIISIELLCRALLDGATLRSFFTITIMFLITIYPGLSFTKRYINATTKIDMIDNSPKIRSYIGGMLMYIYIFLTIPSIVLAFTRQLLGKTSWFKTTREENVSIK
ncbi:glycosyltransferase [Enterococcus sp. DIV0242_7C1]|uniref:Glycosyltransferase 2-like domain-containing protein n=1 Tax=Candidatus Enterococcus dunnyi TaxID=1834192 RepID=A0A200J9S7_9ENTE|nr:MULTISPECIES: glycosyltransferase [unclassified Enterococcus]MBO0471983.1 glycosyltransferase [Enterococcus sp. DIV0242_7C1]OUZ33609.1 hypothetical protein A5889_002324 [Enterococcus sp. 9D6_DIV0238]